MVKLNKIIGSWDIRRVFPTIITPNFWNNNSQGMAMCPSL